MPKIVENKIFSIQNLTKSFGKTKIFENISFDFVKGDRIALVGYNGVGKTTLINMICGLSKITGGKIIFADKKNFFKNLGIHFQTGMYPHGIRICDLIWLYNSAYLINLQNSIFFKSFEIDSLFKKKLSSLSFGQMKRLELFLIMAADNKNLILDEITSGMDIWVRYQILQSLFEHVKTKKISLIYISHNYDEIKKICNRLVIMSSTGIITDQKITSTTNIQKIIEDKIRKLKLVQ